MGWGGYLVLINLTPFAWHSTSEHNGDMNNWNLPSAVGTGQYSSSIFRLVSKVCRCVLTIYITSTTGETLSSYIEFKTWSNEDWGLTQYTLDGYNSSVAIEVGINGSDESPNSFYYLMPKNAPFEKVEADKKTTTKFIHDRDTYITVRFENDVFNVDFVASVAQPKVVMPNDCPGYSCR